LMQVPRWVLHVSKAFVRAITRFFGWAFTNHVLSLIHISCSNMFLNYIGKPSIYIPCCMIAWGAISALTGATHKLSSIHYSHWFESFPHSLPTPNHIGLLVMRPAYESCLEHVINFLFDMRADGALDLIQCSVLWVRFLRASSSDSSKPHFFLVRRFFCRNGISGRSLGWGLPSYTAVSNSFLSSMCAYCYGFSVSMVYRLYDVSHWRVWLTFMRNR